MKNKSKNKTDVKQSEVLRTFENILDESLNGSASISDDDPSVLVGNIISNEGRAYGLVFRQFSHGFGIYTVLRDYIVPENSRDAVIHAMNDLNAGLIRGAFFLTSEGQMCFKEFTPCHQDESLSISYIKSNLVLGAKMFRTFNSELCSGIVGNEEYSITEDLV